MEKVPEVGASTSTWCFAHPSTVLFSLEKLKRLFMQIKVCSGGVRLVFKNSVAECVSFDCVDHWKPIKCMPKAWINLHTTARFAVLDFQSQYFTPIAECTVDQLKLKPQLNTAKFHLNYELINNFKKFHVFISSQSSQVSPIIRSIGVW